MTFSRCGGNAGGGSLEKFGLDPNSFEDEDEVLPGDPGCPFLDES